MLNLVDPNKNAAIQSFVKHLAHLAGSLPRSQRAAIDSRYAHIYGELQGQRALKVDMDAIGGSNHEPGQHSNYSIIIAFEAYFAILCNLISASAITGNPINFAASSRQLTLARQNSLLADIATGRFHAERGLSHYSDLFDINFLGDALPVSMGEAVDHLFSSIEDFWSDPILSTSFDPMQMIHDRVFPKNLCHVTGQFYTPPWLCSLLLDDVSVKQDSTIVDPFCGSGAFLMAAIQKLMQLGLSVEEANRQIMGIDLSPSACLATRTNIVLNSIRTGLKDPSRITLNVMCADALAPAVTEGNGLAQGMFAKSETKVHIDGEVINIDPSKKEEMSLTASLLKEYGIATDVWIDRTDCLPAKRSRDKDTVRDGRSRKIAEQMAVFNLSKASILVTNPPWVGWEYMSRPYRDYLNPAWNVYGLFEQKGLEAAFLKEDLSTLCVATATDRFLRDKGEAALLLRPATMQSDLAARGLRRLTIFPDREPLNLTLIREFDEMKVFGNAATHAAAWILRKGSSTVFPVPVEKWSRMTRRWQPTQEMPLEEVRAHVEVTRPVCCPADPAKQTGRWAISTLSASAHKDQLLGTNELQPRIGFFTGGANAVYYMRPLGQPAAPIKYENVTERAKRSVPQVQVELEPDLMYEVIRGRDIAYWNATPEVLVLCPHTRETKMYPIEENKLRKAHPKAMAYFENLRPFLESRNGFAGWEKNIHKQHYYTLQRLGEYSFAPYKVCWKYIAGDFVISVVGPGISGRPILPNDKVVFIPFEAEDAAYFCAGVLSSSPIRYSVVSSMSARQISASIIKQYGIPTFSSDNPLHLKIMGCCLAGHASVKVGRFDEASKQHSAMDRYVAELYGMDQSQLDHFVEALKSKLKHFPFASELVIDE